MGEARGDRKSGLRYAWVSLYSQTGNLSGSLVCSLQLSLITEDGNLVEGISDHSTSSQPSSCLILHDRDFHSFFFFKLLSGRTFIHIIINYDVLGCTSFSKYLNVNNGKWSDGRNPC